MMDDSTPSWVAREERRQILAAVHKIRPVNRFEPIPPLGCEHCGCLISEDLADKHPPVCPGRRES